MISETKTVVDSLRGALQDVLVPELKVLQAELRGMQTEMRLRDDKFHSEMRLRDDKLYAEMRLRDENTQKSIQSLAEKLDLRSMSASG